MSPAAASLLTPRVLYGSATAYAVGDAWKNCEPCQYINERMTQSRSTYSYRGRVLCLCLCSDDRSLHLHSCIRHVPPLALSGSRYYARRRNRLQLHWSGETHAVRYKEALEMNVMLVQYPDAKWATSMSMGVDELFERSSSCDQ